MTDPHKGHHRAEVGEDADEPEVPFGSNAVRLSGRQWFVAAIGVLAVITFTPAAWEKVEKLELVPDYRLPYALSSDYWLFSRYCRVAASRYKTLVIGDSVMWGQYVRKDQTLTHYLNDLAGESRFANMGVDGMHPAALAGLMHYYGRSISDKNVIVHCNPLWLSSKKHDLQTEKEFRFNHPGLVPQFVPSILCYRDPYSGRVGIVIERTVPFLAWANHLRLAYFDQMDIPTWTLEHPYGNLAGAAAVGLPAPDEGVRHEPIQWTERGIDRQSLPWVELETSFQWRSFQRLVAMLEARGHRLFVLVGPFNEHMLEQTSLDTYVRMKGQMSAWLRERGVAHYVPPALPSEHCADASHPLSEGYASLARQLFQDEGFVQFNAR